MSRLFSGPFQIISEFTTGGATGSLFWTWLTALALAQAMFNSRIKRGWRVVLIALVLAVFYLNVFRGARWSSGWIPPLVAVFAILWIGLPRIATAASLAGALAFLASAQRLTNFVMVGDNQYSLVTRLEAWRLLAEIVRVNPLLGLGPANYYWYAPLFPILGYSVRFSSHNNYVDIVAQIGFLGLICFFWFAWAIARVGWKLLGKLPEGFARAYVIGALAGLAGTLAAGMLGDWVIPFVYNVGLDGMRASLLGWMFLGGIVAVEQMSRRGNVDPLETLS
jgi:O-antigen ligase